MLGKSFIYIKFLRKAVCREILYKLALHTQAIASLLLSVIYHTICFALKFHTENLNLFHLSHIHAHSLFQESWIIIPILMFYSTKEISAMPE